MALDRRISLKSRLSVPLTLVFPSRIAFRLASHCVVPSTEDADYLRLELGVSRDRITVAHTGVDEHFLRIERDSESVGVQFLHIGSWIDRKGTPELVEAWSAVARAEPSVTLAIVGTGVPTIEVLDAFEQPLRERVFVQPSVDQPGLERWLASSDVFVLASWFEGMPLSMLEAAASGLPCIVTSICGNVDFVLPQSAEDCGGLLVEPSDPVGLEHSLRRVVFDQELRTRLGSCARDRARAFTWSRTAEALAAAYARAADG